MHRPALAALTSMAVAQLRDEDGGILQSSGGKLRRGGSLLKRSRDIDDAGVVPAIRCGVAAAHLAQAIVGSAIMTMGAYLSWANALTYGLEVGALGSGLIEINIQNYLQLILCVADSKVTTTPGVTAPTRTQTASL